MGIQLDFEVRIDKQGRIVIPSEVRKQFGLHPGSKTRLTFSENKLILTLEDADLKKQVDTWYSQMLENQAQAFTATEEFPESKWMSEEYGKRKAGLLGRDH